MSEPNLQPPTDAELIEARDRADAGLRLALPILFDGLGADPAPTMPSVVSVGIGPDVADTVAGELSDARESVLGAGRALPLDGNADLHLRFNALVNEIDRAVSVLAERRGS